LSASSARHWSTILIAKDEGEAQVLEQAMRQDGVKARVGRGDHAEGEEALKRGTIGL